MTGQRNQERRVSRKWVLHKHRRSMHVAEWMPGVLTLVAGAGILWVASELNENGRWHAEYGLRVQHLEAAVRRLNVPRRMKGIYMNASYVGEGRPDE